MVLSAARLSRNESALLKRLDGIQLDDLVRGLVLRLSRGIPSDGFGQNGCASDEILLDTHIDGVRYLLVRMPAAAPSALSLSPREQEIVRMVAKGYSNKIIADVLNISSWTVCTHLRRIFAKLGVASRAAVVAQLLKEGWIRDHAYPNGKLPHDAQKRPDSAASVTNMEPLSDLTTPETWRPHSNMSRGKPSATSRKREAACVLDCAKASKGGL